jgi:hypothetical protein
MVAVLSAKGRAKATLGLHYGALEHYQPGWTLSGVERLLKADANARQTMS